jgi:hypothetical protein
MVIQNEAGLCCKMIVAKTQGTNFPNLTFFEGEVQSTRLVFVIHHSSFVIYHSPMPIDPSLEPILQRVPQFASARELDVSELSGGITNKNYKVVADGEAYVLRMGGNETQFLGIDRKVEYGCTLAASRVGVAPEPVAFLEPEGYLVTRFISAPVFPPTRSEPKPTSAAWSPRSNAITRSTISPALSPRSAWPRRTRKPRAAST